MLVSVFCWMQLLSGSSVSAQQMPRHSASAARSWGPTSATSCASSMGKVSAQSALSLCKAQCWLDTQERKLLDLVGSSGELFHLQASRQASIIGLGDCGVWHDMTWCRKGQRICRRLLKRVFWGCLTGRRLATLGGAPLRKLLELIQEATQLINSCCQPGIAICILQFSL